MVFWMSRQPVDPSNSYTDGTQFLVFILSINIFTTLSIDSKNWFEPSETGNTLMCDKKSWIYSVLISRYFYDYFPAFIQSEFVLNAKYHLRAVLQMLSITWHCKENCKSHEKGEKKKTRRKQNKAKKPLICVTTL